MSPGNQSYDNRSTHDMFCIIEGQSMESQSLVSLNYTLCLFVVHFWVIVDHNHDHVYCNPLKMGVS